MTVETPLTHLCECMDLLLLFFLLFFVVVAFSVTLQREEKEGKLTKAMLLSGADVV
jgi:hypothetical protein